MIWWPLLFTLTAFAEDPSVEEFCYASPERRAAAHARMRAVFLPVDQVTPHESCLTVMAPPHRRELIQAYARRVDPEVKISFSSAEITRDPCKLKVERVKQSQGSDLNASANTDVSVTQAQSKGAATDTMQVITLNKFELSYNQDLIQGDCKYITPDRYEITLEVRKDPKPLIPPVPPGTIVVVPSVPTDVQKTSTFKSELQLTRGQRIEVGSVLKDKNDQNYSISASPDLGAGKSQQSETEKLYLSLD